MNISRHTRVQKYLSAISTGLLLLGIASIPAQAASATDELSITGISVASVSDTSLNPVRHQVTISGTFTNTSPQTASTTIELLTGQPISTRSALMSAITTNSYEGLTNHSNVIMRLNNVASQQSQNWQLIFNGDDFFTTEAAVAVFGARIAGTSEQIVIPHSWYFKDDVKPTQLLVSAAVTTTSFHEVGQPIDGAVGTNEIDRINNLLDSLPEKSHVAVDPYVRDWLKDFSDTPLSAKATQLNERLNRYGAYSTVYAQTDIFRTMANKLSSLTNDALTSEDDSITMYAPASDVVSKNVFNQVANQRDTLMVIPSDVFGSAQQSIPAHGVSNGTNFLVADSGLAECLQVNDELLARACLTSMLTVATAESPNKSRTLALNIPLNALDVPALKALAQPESFSNSFALVDIDTALNSSGVTHSIPQGPSMRNDFPTSVRKGLSTLASLSKSVAAVFEDESLSRQLNATRFMAVSTLRADQKIDLDFITNAATYATDQLHTLSLQGSSRITIPGTKSQLPLTIVNGSNHTATVGVQLSSSLPGRISAANIDVVTIEAGQRVTVSIPITVSGAGLIPVEATLTSRDNDSFGKSLSMQIGSSAYQDIARNLVWTALALLVVLLANGLRKRRRPS